MGWSSASAANSAAGRGVDTGAGDVSAVGSVAGGGGKAVWSGDGVTDAAIAAEVRSSRGGETVADSRHRGDVETEARW